MPEFPVWQRHSANQRRTRSRPWSPPVHADLDQLGDPRLWSMSEHELAEPWPRWPRCGTGSPSSSSGSPPRPTTSTSAPPPVPRTPAATGPTTTRQTKRDAKRRLALAHALDHDHEPVRDAMAAGTRVRGAGRGDREGCRRAAGRAPPQGRDPPDRVRRRPRPGRAAPARPARPRSRRPRDRRSPPAPGPATPGSPRRGSLPVHHHRRRTRPVPRPVHPAQPRRRHAQAGGARDQLTPSTATTPAPPKGSGTRSASTSPATPSTGSPRPAASTPPWWSP